MPEKEPMCTTAVYAPEALKERIRLVALADGRSISSWARLRLKEAVEREEAK